MTKVSFKQYSSFVDATDAELDEGFGEFVSKVFGGKPDEQKLAKLKADRQKLLTKKSAAQIARDKAKDELWKATAKKVADNGHTALTKKNNEPSGSSGAPAQRSGRSLAAQGRAAELDWVNSMESAINFAREYQLDEGVMSAIHQELTDLVPEIESGKVDLYDVLAHTVKGVSADTAEYLQHRYDEIASEHGYHNDDDHEEILDTLADELMKEFPTKQD